MLCVAAISAGITPIVRIGSQDGISPHACSCGWARAI